MNFWEEITLDQMNDEQWESLCDGCGICCLHKFEDELTHELRYTCVKCKYLNTDRSCSVYSNRTEIVNECLNIRDLPRNFYRWLPESCAYRRIHENRGLPDWHPLVTGSTYQMEKSIRVVSNWAIPDTQVVPNEDLIINMKISDS